MTSFDLSPDAPVLQPAYIRLMCEVVQKKGIALDDALQRAGLASRQALQAREALVSVRQLETLLRAARNSGFDDRIALEVGTLLQISAHGPLGYAAMASPSLDAALNTVGRYAPIRNRAVNFVYRSGPQTGVLEIKARMDLGATLPFLMTCMAITIAQVAAAVHGGDHALQEVGLPFSRPAWADALQACMRCRCTFDTTCLSFRWNAHDLHSPNSTADPQAFGDAVRTCEQQLSALQAQSITQQVQETLLAREAQWPELLEVAAIHRMSARTLIRKLKEEGSSFQALRDQLRAKRAEFYLTQTQLSVEEVAHRLGYKDTSNFSRSFRRWFKTTPGQMRSGLTPSPPPS